MLNTKTYSLYRCKKVLRHYYSRYKRKRKHLSDIQKKRFENILTSLQTSINKKNKKAADRAAKNLENNKKIKFIIVGGGHQKTYIEKAKSMELTNVIFTGHIENPIPSILAFDVFTLLSTAHEGVSQASLQAAFLQKPLITTPTGGLKEVCIDNQTGILVPIFSPNKIIEAILKLEKDKNLRDRYAQNAKKLASDFSQENMIDKMSRVYMGLF